MTTDANSLYAKELRRLTRDISIGATLLVAFAWYCIAGVFHPELVAGMSNIDCLILAALQIPLLLGFAFVRIKLFQANWDNIEAMTEIIALLRASKKTLTKPQADSHLFS